MAYDVPEQPPEAAGNFVGRIETELLNHRKVLIFGDINDRLARDICARLLLLADRDADSPIDIFINSPGGTSSPAIRSTTWCASSATTFAST
jgi:ATP-dependent Clp protease protease subunit